MSSIFFIEAERPVSLIKCLKNSWLFAVCWEVEQTADLDALSRANILSNAQLGVKRAAWRPLRDRKYNNE